ncbi:MAG: hypothetical protein H0W06_10945 [Chloroflexia bacterium]|nr:hypothetical protein [Chloroflexia bacterium]
MSRRQERQYDIDLGEGGFIRVRRTNIRDKIIAFTAQYEPFVEGWFRPAVRYDTAHGRAHRDTLDWDGRPIRGLKEWLPVSMNFNEAFTFAEQDLKTNWLKYLTAFLRRRR